MSQTPAPPDPPPPLDELYKRTGEFVYAPEQSLFRLSPVSELTAPIGFFAIQELSHGEARRPNYLVTPGLMELPAANRALAAADERVATSETPLRAPEAFAQYCDETAQSIRQGMSEAGLYILGGLVVYDSPAGAKSSVFFVAHAIRAAQLTAIKIVRDKQYNIARDWREGVREMDYMLGRDHLPSYGGFAAAAVRHLIASRLPGRDHYRYDLAANTIAAAKPAAAA